MFIKRVPERPSMTDPSLNQPESEDFEQEERELEQHGLHFELNRRTFMQTAGAFSAAIALGLPETGKVDHPEMTDDEIRERMSGNICRCGAYPNIVAAVRSVARGESA
jgi:hypothetical protein